MSKESEHGATEHFASLRWVESCKTDSAAALHHIRKGFSNEPSCLAVLFFQ